MDIHAEMARALKLRQADFRAARLIDASVAYSLQTQGEPNEDNFRRWARDVAEVAVSALLRQLYDEDAELFVLRQERDHYKELALSSLALCPRPHTLEVRP